jgi:predicted ATPase
VLFALPGLTAWRARIEEDAMAAIEVHTAAAMADGRAADVIPRLQQLVVDHPYRENLWAALMRSLYAGGRQADALAVYQRARRTLADDLGVEPGSELQAIERAILLQAPEVDPPKRHASLPSYRTSFVGREADVERLVQLVAEARLVTVLGPGGVGKTRLVAEGLRSLADSAPVSFVDLAPSEADTIERLSTVVAHALGTVPGPSSALDALAASLGSAGGVLVLDSCEHVAEAVADLAHELLDRCPELTVVATSRVRLNVEGEVVLRVAPLAIDEEGDRTPSAVRLLLDRASAVRPGFAGDEDLAMLRSLAARLDGVPLALEMAAARLASLSLPDLVTRLEGGSEQLVRPGRHGPARHATLDATIAWSFGLLTDGAQQLLARLSVFAGGWTLVAVDDVAPSDGHVGELLHELVAASLVELGGRGDAGRYRLLEPVRDFARSRLELAKEAMPTERLHARWMLRVAEANESELFSEGVETRAKALDAERENIGAALDWSLVHDPEIGTQLVAAVAWWWQLRGLVTEARSRLERALAIETDPSLVRARLLRRYGAVLGHLDVAEHTIAILSEACALATELDAPRLRASTLHNLGFVHRARRDLVEARRCVTEAAALWDELGQTSAHALSLGLLGDIATEAGEFDDATARYAEGLALMRRTGSRHGLLAYLHSMAELAIHQGDLERANGLLTEAAPLAREIGDAFHVAAVHQARGHLAMQQGRTVESAQELTSALDGFWVEQRDLAASLVTADLIARLARTVDRPEDAWALAEGIEHIRETASMPRAPSYRPMADATRAGLDPGPPTSPALDADGLLALARDVARAIATD